MIQQGKTPKIVHQKARKGQIMQKTKTSEWSNSTQQLTPKMAKMAQIVENDPTTQITPKMAKIMPKWPNLTAKMTQNEANAAISFLYNPFPDSRLSCCREHSLTFFFFFFFLVCHTTGKNLYWTFFCQLYWNDENKEKEAGKGPFFKKTL